MGKLAVALRVVAVSVCEQQPQRPRQQHQPARHRRRIVLDVNGETPRPKATYTMQTAGVVMMAMTDATGI